MFCWVSLKLTSLLHFSKSLLAPFNFSLATEILSLAVDNRLMLASVATSYRFILVLAKLCQTTPKRCDIGLRMRTTLPL